MACACKNKTQEAPHREVIKRTVNKTGNNVARTTSGKRIIRRIIR
jgi:hypothetical protein